MRVDDNISDLFFNTEHHAAYDSDDGQFLEHTPLPVLGELELAASPPPDDELVAFEWDPLMAATPGELLPPPQPAIRIVRLASTASVRAVVHRRLPWSSPVAVCVARSCAPQLRRAVQQRRVPWRCHETVLGEGLWVMAAAAPVACWAPSRCGSLPVCAPRRGKRTTMSRPPLG